MQQSILVIIPCFNEAATIASTLRELQDVLVNTIDISYEILVINDCSTDKSLEEIKKIKVLKKTLTQA